MWPKTPDAAVRWLIAAIAMCTLIVRAQVIHDFGWAYTGTDDTVIWLIAREYAEGVFREPYMYGQNYNPMLEALIAAPFLRWGAQPWTVLPIVSTLIALLPFWSFSLWHLRRREHGGALLFATMPLMLSGAWDLSTTITRGIAHGLPFVALVPWVLGGRPSTARWSFASLLTCIGLLCNPNALVLAAFLYVPVIIASWKRAAFWIASALGAVPAAAYWWMGRRFFADHPWDMVHVIDRAELMFDPVYFTKAFTQLNIHFKGIMPLWWPNGWIILVALTAMIILLWRRGERPQAWGVIAAVALMLFALGTSKAHNGCGSAFFPLSRLFLAAPLLLAAGIATITGATAIGKRGLIVTLAGVAVLTIAKTTIFPDTLARELRDQSCALAPERPLKDVLSRCQAIGDAARATNAELIAPIKWPGLRADPPAHFRAYFDCYACSFLITDIPVYGPGYDRRSWMRAQWANRPAPRTLFVGGDPEGWRKAVHLRGGIMDRSTATTQLHMVTPDALNVGALSVHLGADDDLGR